MNDARLRRLAECIHNLGPRPLFEMLRELDAGAELGPTLEVYAELQARIDFIRELGGDRLPVLRAVRGS